MFSSTSSLLPKLEQTLLPLFPSPSDIEDFESTDSKKLWEILAKEIGLFADEIEIYGKSKAKVRLSLLERLKDQADGKYCLGCWVRAIFLNLLLRIHVCKTLHPIYIATPLQSILFSNLTLFCPFHLVLLHLMWDKFLFSVQNQTSPGLHRM